MIEVKVNNEWHELDTLNGYYRLEDLFKSAGSPEGKDPRDFINECGPHSAYSIQRKKHVWASQSKVYAYAGFLDEEFQKIMDEVLTSGNIELASTIATGVMHK